MLPLIFWIKQNWPLFLFMLLAQIAAVVGTGLVLALVKKKKLAMSMETD
jgi:hypothetical protein